MMSNSGSKILVIGSGNFGSCLADHLAECRESGKTDDTPTPHHHQVCLYSRDSDTVKLMNAEQRNPKYLKDHHFAKSLKTIGPEFPATEFLDECDVIVSAVPTKALRTTLELLNLNALKKTPLMVFVNKGIELGTLALPIEVIKDVCGEKIAQESTFLSGPSFASEIIRRQPTQVTVASFSADHANATSKLFHQPYFRCYPNLDPIGVELAGAFKNVYAIASGVAAGLGYESNTRAGLVTRGLAEMTRIGVSRGAQPITFLSLAGVGDIFLTCSSEKSRNYTVGYRLGKGETLEHVLQTLGSVAEGVETAKSGWMLVKNSGVDAPILEHVYKLLWEGEKASDLAAALMSRPMVYENVGMITPTGSEVNLHSRNTSSSNLNSTHGTST